jgi:hypothetical protein
MIAPSPAQRGQYQPNGTDSFVPLAQFPSWYVLAPLAWSAPIMGTGEETVASIAEERGSIGLKFMLYTRSMQLWNGLFGIYRQLQWVGGNAERLVDLVVLLVRHMTLISPCAI